MRIEPEQLGLKQQNQHKIRHKWTLEGFSTRLLGVFDTNSLVFRQCCLHPCPWNRMWVADVGNMWEYDAIWHFSWISCNFLVSSPKKRTSDQFRDDHRVLAHSPHGKWTVPKHLGQEQHQAGLVQGTNVLPVFPLVGCPWWARSAKTTAVSVKFRN